jgi:outer membrane protein
VLYALELPVKSHISVALLATILSPVLVQSATAQEAAPTANTLPADKPDIARDRVTIGVGAVYMPSYEGSNDYVVTPAGAARGTVHDFSFFTRNTQLYVNAIPREAGPGIDFELGPIVGINLNRTGKLADPQIRALGHRKLAVEAGGFVGIGKTGLITSDYDNLSLRVAYVHDVSGIYRSYVVTPMIEYSTPLSRKAFVGLSISADYAGTGYATAYYDVDAAGSLRSGLPVFSGRKGWKDVAFGVVGSRSLTGDLLHGLGIFATGSYSRLQGDFAASPVTSVVGSRNQWLGALGLGYTF